MDLSAKSTNKIAFHEGDKTALIDADIIARACACASDGMYYLVQEDVEDSDTPLIYHRCDYKKEAKEFCKLNNLPLNLITQYYKPEPLENCLHSAKMMYQSIVDAVGASSAIGFLTPPGGNFRDNISVTVPYKGTRWDSIKRADMRKRGKWLEWLDKTEPTFREQRHPAHLNETKNYLYKHLNCQIAHGQEADDAMGIYQCNNWNTIICSIDKDLDMIPGWHYRWAIFDSEPITYFIPKDVALRKFYEQLLKGDMTDNIVGLPGIGPVKAAQALKDCETEEEMFNVVLCMYDGNYERVLENGRLLWIRRQEGEIWTPNI